MRSTSRAVFIALLGALCLLPLVPAGATRSLVGDVFGVLCVALGLYGAWRIPGPARRGWLLVTAGFAGWALGDVVYSVEQYGIELAAYPAPSDVPYLASYAVLAAGLLHLARGRRMRSDPTLMLDASIVALSFGVVVGTFVVSPVASDSTVPVLGRIVTSAYPIADVLLLAVLVRLWATASLRSPSFRLLVVALLSVLVADLTWNVMAIADPTATAPAWLDQLWLLGYLAGAAAACTRSAPALGEDGLSLDGGTSANRRLVALGCALVLPGATLLADGLLGHRLPWLLVSIGSVALSMLVLARMGVLVRTVEVQAVQLAALARSDGLTGAPNRRTWDHELGRAVQQAEDTDAPLTVALIDLDHFKRFNDERGHQAGDLLLREAVAAWSSLLAPHEVLARYGGEEFGVLLPGSTTEQACELLDTMQGLTPYGQRFSAGVAAWEPGAEPSRLVEMADRALYEAKHAGRARVRVANAGCPERGLPALRIAFQPIVDLRDGTVVGHEALSRFPDGDPETVFAQAHRAGQGPALEAAAIRAALAERPDQGYVSVNLSIGSLGAAEVEAVLPGDLHDVVIEITEQTDTDDWDAAIATVAALRGRGATIALDDWGKGYSNVERILRLRPEVVKLDRSLLAGLDGDRSRADALRALAEWARSMGALVCAEGVETREQWAVLRDVGIVLGQGYHFGRPEFRMPSPTLVEATAAALVV